MVIIMVLPRDATSPSVMFWNSKPSDDFGKSENLHILIDRYGKALFYSPLTSSAASAMIP